MKISESLGLIVAVSENCESCPTLSLKLGSRDGPTFRLLSSSSEFASNSESSGSLTMDVACSSVEVSRDDEPYPVSWYRDSDWPIAVVVKPNVFELDWLTENGDAHGSGEFERFAKGSAKGFSSRMWREGAKRSSKLSMCEIKCDARELIS